MQALETSRALNLGDYASQLQMDPSLGSGLGGGVVLGADGNPVYLADNTFSNLMDALSGFAKAGAQCTAGPCSD